MRSAVQLRASQAEACRPRRVPRSGTPPAHPLSRRVVTSFHWATSVRLIRGSRSLRSGLWLLTRESFKLLPLTVRYGPSISLGFGKISVHRSRTPTQVPRADSKEAHPVDLVHSHTDSRIRRSEHDRSPAATTGTVRFCDDQVQ